MGAPKLSFVSRTDRDKNAEKEARVQRRGEEEEETRGVARRRRTTDHRFRQSEEGRGCACEVFGQQWLSCVLDSRWQEPGATRMGHELLQGRQVRYSRGHGCGWQRFGYRGVMQVINFDMPKTIEDYTHRIGRTGRAGNKGLATSMVTPEDSEIFYDLTQFLKSSNQIVPPEL